MKHMKEVTRYQCQFCKKDFKTPDRHHCKFNPKLKNCFTCRHSKGWNADDYEVESDVFTFISPDCNAGMGGWELEDIKNCNYNMQCDKWEQGKFDWAKENEDTI